MEEKRQLSRDGRASERKIVNEQMKNYVNAHVAVDAGCWLLVSLKSDHRPNDHFAMKSIRGAHGK